MKMFSLKGLLGMAAIGGAYAYAHKHGGFKNAYNHLLAKKDELMAKKDEIIARSSEGRSSEGQRSEGVSGSNVSGNVSTYGEGYGSPIGREGR